MVFKVNTIKEHLQTLQKFALCYMYKNHTLLYIFMFRLDNGKTYFTYARIFMIS